jgi:16S rRNA (guanine966-N2)-methyltransferase
LRIIRGKYRGKTLHPPTSFRARPTTDFAKEGLFNILENFFDMEGLTVLDLFSGTGSISYEFASRGAMHIDAVELDPFHSRYIRKMAEELKFDQLYVIRGDAFRYLKRSFHQYDIIFADPPYELKGIESIAEAVFKGGWLREGGWLIVEHGKSTSFIHHPFFLQEREYGSVHFSILNNTPSKQE